MFSQLILVAVRCDVQLCGRLIAGTAGLSPAEGMDVCLVFVVCCVGSGLCDGLITRSEESYRVCVCVCVCVCVGLIVCNLETITLRLSWPMLGCCATEKEISQH